MRDPCALRAAAHPDATGGETTLLSPGVGRGRVSHLFRWYHEKDSQEAAVSKKTLENFTLPSVEPSEEFLQELAAVSKNHAPLNPVPSRRRRRTTNWLGGLAVAGAMAFGGAVFFSNSVLHRGVDAGQCVEGVQDGSSTTSTACAGGAAATGDSSFTKDGGYTSRYNSEGGQPETDPSTSDDCWDSTTNLLAYVVCELRKEPQ